MVFSEQLSLHRMIQGILFLSGGLFVCLFSVFSNFSAMSI